MNATVIVFKKELREMLRDRRVRSSAIIMPMILVFGMLAMFGFISGVDEKQNQKIDVVKSAPNPILDALRAAKFQITEIGSVEEGKDLVRQGKARLVLDFPPDATQALQSDGKVKIDAYYDPQQQTAQIAKAQTQSEIDGVNKAIRDTVLAAHNISKDQIEPVRLVDHEVQVGKKQANELLVSLLPYFIVIWAFYGGFGSAGDLVAGEKEKSTLETLLIAPVGRTQIALGKFLALMSICFLSSVSALAGFIIAGVSKAHIFEKLFPPPQGLGIGLPEIGTIVLLLIPTVAFFASLLIAISTYAKNSREAQTYLALVSFVILMPAIFGQVIGLTDLTANWWIRLVPVLNTSVALREALQGKSDLVGVMLTIVVGVVLAAIGIRVAVALFKREQVLTRV